MRGLRLASLALAAAALYAACGGGDDPAEERASATPPLEVVETSGLEPGSGLRLDVVRPLAEGPWPVVVLLRAPDNDELAAFGRVIAREGAVVFDAPFRTIEEGARFPDAFAEIACSVRYARSQAEAHGGDNAGVALLGHSAGAYAAAVVALGGGTRSGDRAGREVRGSRRH